MSIYIQIYDMATAGDVNIPYINILEVNRVTSPLKQEEEEMN